MQVVIVQYLYDILFVGRDHLLTTQAARDTTAHLTRKGFLVSPKSDLDATQPLAWMGKQLSLDRLRVAHKPKGAAVLRSACPATRASPCNGCWDASGGWHALVSR